MCYITFKNCRKYFLCYGINIYGPTIKDTIDTLYATFIFDTDVYESLLASMTSKYLEDHETK